MKLKLIQTIIMLSKYFAYGVFVQVLMMNLLIAGDSEAQRSKSVKEVEIAIKSQESSVEKIFGEIENLTDFTISYDRKEIKNKLKQSITVKSSQNVKVSDILIEIARQTNLSFRQVNQNISASKAENGFEEQIQIAVLEEVDVSGKVTDENGQGLPGATVLIKGTAKGVTTDFEGNYKLSAPDDAVLVISFIGYKNQEITLSGRSVIDVQMTLDAQKLEEIVVVGYGTQERANVTNAISQIKSASFKDIPVSSIEQGIASQLAGVNVVQASGAPGKDSQINIRGVGTITAGTNPLIVIDGLPASESTTLNSINPADIESVDVLKDAASAAIYGSRGSNGVILITTKPGDSGKTKFSFNSYRGVQKVANKLDLVGAYDHAQWDWDARNNYYLRLDPNNHSVNDDNATRQTNAAALGGNIKKVIIPDYVQPYLNGTQGLTDTDWQDAIFRDAKIESYHISASGGNENTKFYVSGNFFNQEGIVVGSGFKRYSFRSNIKSKLNDRLTISVNVAPTFTDRDNDPEGWTSTPVTQAINSLPYFPVYDSNGNLTISEQINAAAAPDQALAENPLLVAEHTRDFIKERNLLAGTSLELEIIEGLKAKTYVGIDLSSQRTGFYRPGFIGAYRAAAPTVASGRTSSSEVLNWVSENTLFYEKNIADHSFTALAGYSIQKETFAFSQIQASDFPNDQVPTLSAGIVNGGTSTEEEWALISYFGRLTYGFQGKYLFSATIRRDGSSRFGASSKWGVFPSVSAGYRISEESFFPKTEIVNDLKLRASWGVSGNNQIANYGSQALLQSSNAVLGGAVLNGLSPATSPNPNLTWEETQTFDFGVDMGFFSDRLTLAFDYYNAKTTNLLLQVPVPAHSGFTSSLQNIGSVRNKGVELALTGKYNLGPVKVTSTFNIASNKNEVLELGPGQEEIITGRHITKVGGELGVHYGYNILGLFQSQQELDNTPHLATSTLGDYIYADNDGNGEINSDDRAELGSFWPDYTFGITSNFEFKGFDLNVVVQGTQGVVVHDRLISVLLYNPEGWGTGSQDYVDNYWTPERGTSAKYARPTPVPRDNGFYRESDLFHDDASYIRFRSITLGYTLPVSISKKAGLTQARVYFSSKNPFTFTDFRGYNPEQSSGNPLQPGLTLGNYPIEKSFVMGVNLTF